MVNTVKGPVKPDELGQTLMHEHIMNITPGIHENWPWLWDESEYLEKAVKRFRELESRGIRSFVNVTTPDMGRNIGFIKKLQTKTNINIILCTGIYFAWGTTFVESPYWIGRSSDEMARVFIHDINVGIQGGEIKAGILKVASQGDEVANSVTPFNDVCLRAIARAHRATGVTITTHAIPKELGMEQQIIFRDEGINLSQVIIGHQGSDGDLDYFKALMDQGSTIGIDNFGIESMEMFPCQSFSARIKVVANLCVDGYSDRIVLSHDANIYSDWGLTDTVIPPDQNPNWHYNYISDAALPALLEHGVSESQINNMMVENPRRLLLPVNSY